MGADTDLEGAGVQVHDAVLHDRGNDDRILAHQLGQRDAEHLLPACDGLAAEMLGPLASVLAKQQIPQVVRLLGLRFQQKFKGQLGDREQGRIFG